MCVCDAVLCPSAIHIIPMYWITTTRDDKSFRYVATSNIATHKCILKYNVVYDDDDDDGVWHLTEYFMNQNVYVLYLSVMFEKYGTPLCLYYTLHETPIRITRMILTNGIGLDLVTFTLG